MKNQILLIFLKLASSAVMAQTRLITKFIRDFTFRLASVKDAATEVVTSVRGATLCKVYRCK